MSRSIARAGAAGTLLALLILVSGPAGQVAGQSPTVDGGPAAAADRIIAETARTDPGLARQLEEIRAATERYRDVEVALEEGYLRDPMDMCVTAGMEGLPRQLGDMGIHFFRPDLLGITATEPRVAGMGAHTDFLQPSVLIYEPQRDGSLELVAVENVVFQAGWEATGRPGVPEFAGNEYYHMVDNPLTEADEAHGFEPHYELHLWLYRENPNGLFAQFNPNVSCAHHGGGHGVH
jgi:hypothetical protein